MSEGEAPWPSRLDACLRCQIALPDVRAKRSTMAGRQAWAGKNVPRTTGPGLVACRWRSA